MQPASADLVANGTPKRFWLVALLAITLLAGSTSVAQTTARRAPTLRDRLFLGLQARRPSEIAFLEAVLDTVDRGDLTERAVTRVFAWSRSRQSRGRAGRRPIILFQAALERIADNLKVEIRADPTPG